MIKLTHASIAAVAALTMAACQSDPPPPPFVQLETPAIVAAAEEIARYEVTNGSPATLAETSKCYSPHVEAATTLTLEMQTCMVREFVVTRTAAGYNEALPQENPNMTPRIRKMLLGMMLTTFTTLLNRYDVPKPEGKDLLGRIAEHGLPAYTAVRLTARPQ